MPKKAKAPRGDYRQAIRAMRLLREAPRRPGDLAEALGCSRRTAERFLRVLEDEGEPLEREERGREAWYSLPEARRAKAGR
jgi:predicted ArsR family transcriptional regulator